MPFGMKNSRATLVGEMRKVLLGMFGVKCYINNLIVFQRLEDAPRNLNFVEFSGQDVEYKWITPNGDNLAKIAPAKRPVTKKKIQSFCGTIIRLLGYYRDYIPSFAVIAALLMDWTSKDQPNFVYWGEAQEKAFNIL